MSAEFKLIPLSEAVVFAQQSSRRREEAIYEQVIDSGGSGIPDIIPASFFRSAGFNLPNRITRVLVFYPNREPAVPPPDHTLSIGKLAPLHPQLSPQDYSHPEATRIPASLLEELIVEAYFSELYEKATEAIVEAQHQLSQNHLPRCVSIAGGKVIPFRKRTRDK